MGTMLIVCMWLLFPGTTRTRYNTIYFLQTISSIGTPWTNYWGSSGWLPWSSLGTLKLAFDLSSDDKGSHPGDLYVSVLSWCTCVQYFLKFKPLQWRHNERDDISNHHRFDYLLNRLFRRRSKKTSKLHVTGLCEGNSPVAGEFPHKGPVTQECFHWMTSSCLL